MTAYNVLLFLIKILIDINGVVLHDYTLNTVCLEYKRSTERKLQDYVDNICLRGMAKFGESTITRSVLKLSDLVL